jgi:uncharacterized membrane protein
MEVLIKAARISFGIMIAGLAALQIVYADFRPVVLPPWTLSFPGHAIFVYSISCLLILGAIAIILDRKARLASLLFGGLFLLLFVACQIPYELFVDPQHNQLGSWTSALKELALAGSGFVVAGSYPVSNQISSGFINGLETMIPYGKVFFSVMLILFGIDHFLYTQWVAMLVPNWIPGHIFWTYFAGVALIGAGITIILKIQLKLSALLLAAMIFLWFILLHIPRAVADPHSLEGNEIASVFEAFGFSGVAYLMAYGYHTKKIL